MVRSPGDGADRRGYLGPVRQAGVGALVLGCTHYPLLKPLLHRVMGPDVSLIDSAAETARALADALQERGIEAPARRDAESPFRGERRRAALPGGGGRFLGDRLAEAEVVDLSP